MLLSIALEELSLAHVLNAEAEKLQKIKDRSSKLGDIFEANENFNKTLRTLIKKEILLEFKFENVLELLKKRKKHCFKDEYDE